MMAYIQNKVFRSIFALVFALVSLNAWSVELKVKNDKTPLYSNPKGVGTPIGFVAHGKVLKTVGDEKNGYYRLANRTNREIWISKKMVEVKGEAAKADAEKDLETKEDVADGEQHESEYPKFTYDLGGGFGSSGGVSYFEFDLGLNTFFQEWISWRNAPFFRHATGLNAYGLDTSVDGHLNLRAGESIGTALSAGVGYRIANQNLSAPFIEGGVGLHLGSIHIGGGVKYLMNSLVRTGVKNDLVFSISLAGGGSI